jgi:hypothetical protein
VGEKTTAQQQHIYQIGWALAASGLPQGLLYIHASDKYFCIPNEAKRKD